MKIASASTKERLIDLINSFYFTKNCIITEDNKVVNTKLNKELGYVKPLKDKFEYYAIK